MKFHVPCSTFHDVRTSTDLDPIRLHPLYFQALPTVLLSSSIWQSIRLLTGGLLVRVQPEEPILSITYASSFSSVERGVCHLIDLLARVNSPER